ncbi:MAG: YicC family protein [Bdellovibrionaceae bacterium]|nr:YicC family protein [Pseudobdellovibrionaceae bacterium]MDW8191027.1 YicC/YloC family endoribonuclease [Pseudobdellovibrionaceae bacterium]
MTGFASQLFHVKQDLFEVSVRSVNSRFLDIKVTVPTFLASLEPEVRALVRNYFYRGQIEVTIKAYSQQASVGGAAVVNYDMLKFYLRLSKKISMDLGASREGVTYNVPDFLRLPGVIEFRLQQLKASQKKLFLKSIQKVLALCQKERRREGRRLRLLLEGYLSVLKKLVEEVEAHFKVHFSVDQPALRLRQKIHQILGQKGLALSEERLMEEWAYLVDRVSIEEEISRIKEHLRHMNEWIQNDTEPIGKKLDFYTQELLREWNTVGSKSMDAQITKMVVQSKNVVENMKEQIQNIQ